MSESGSLPFDVTVAHQARMYDYVLGGKDNFAADRAAADEMMKVYPELIIDMRENRAFLRRLIRYLAGEAGMRQFLDIGTGIPAAGNTHEVAQAIAPQASVVYVDHDPIVLAHARALLTSSGGGAIDYVDADLRDTGTILARARQVRDFSRPVAITLLAILHAIPDADDPHAIVARLLDAVPSGSYLAVSHPGADRLEATTKDALGGLTDQMLKQKITYRTRDQVARFFEGTDLVEPGIVPVEEWRPEPGAGNTGRSSVWCAVGRKRLRVVAVQATGRSVPVCSSQPASQGSLFYSPVRPDSVAWELPARDRRLDQFGVYPQHRGRFLRGKDSQLWQGRVGDG